MLEPQGAGVGAGTSRRGYSWTSRRRSGCWDIKAWVLVPQGTEVGARTSRRWCWASRRRSGCWDLKAQEWVLEPHLKAWVLGPSMCKLVLYVQIVTLASTTFILTAMSVDRYLAI